MKIKLITLIAASIWAGLATGQTVVRSLDSSASQDQTSGSNQTTIRKSDGTVVKVSNSDPATFTPKKFGLNLFAGYAGMDSRTESKMSDIVSGFGFGLDFFYGKSFLFDVGMDAKYYFKDSKSADLIDFPIRIGYQRGWINSNQRATYVRLLTGPSIGLVMEDLYTKTTETYFNCQWNVKLQVEIGKFQIFASTAWGMYGIEFIKGYKTYVDSPITCGIAWVVL